MEEEQENQAGGTAWNERSAVDGGHLMRAVAQGR